MKKKNFSKRRRSLREVRASVHTHRDKVGSLLEQRPAALALATPDGGVFSCKPHFDLMDGELVTLDRGLVAADDAHTRNLVRIVELRKESEDLTADVYEKQVSARRVLSGTYGSGHDFELAAIEGATPQFSETLAGQVDQTVKLLREPAAAEPSKKIRGVELDREEMAEDLKENLGKLLDARTQLQRTRKAADGTLVELKAARKRFDKTFPWVAGNLESLFRLAGEFELADRIRTSTRRVTRRQADPEEEATEEAASPEAASQEELASQESPDEAPSAEAPSAEAATSAVG